MHWLILLKERIFASMANGMRIDRTMYIVLHEDIYIIGRQKRLNANDAVNKYGNPWLLASGRGMSVCWYVLIRTKKNDKPQVHMVCTVMHAGPPTRFMQGVSEVLTLVYLYLRGKVKFFYQYSYNHL